MIRAKNYETASTLNVLLKLFRENYWLLFSSGHGVYLQKQDYS